MRWKDEIFSQFMGFLISRHPRDLSSNIIERLESQSSKNIILQKSFGIVSTMKQKMKDFNHRLHWEKNQGEDKASKWVGREDEKNFKF